MNIIFVASGSEQLAITLLGNMAIQKGHAVDIAFSAALFKDHRVKFLSDFFDDTDYILNKIEKEKPDILAFSCLTQSYQWMLGVARDAKKIYPNLKTVFGGVHVSAVPELAIQKTEVDYVVVGEGEEAFFNIIDSIKVQDFKTSISNVLFKDDEGKVIRGNQKGFFQELNELPSFTKGLWEKYTPVKDNYITMATRGCPYRCTFCFNNFFAELPDSKKKGRYVRTRSINHVINELKESKKRLGKINYIDFQDDIFTVDKKWLKEFLEIYKKEIDIPFQCLTHPRYMDSDIASWLKKAGCVWVQIGIQTMDDGFKNSSLKRFEKSGHIEKALKAMNDAGLKIKADHMLALPDEPLEAQENARILYAENCPTRIQTFWTCFLPGTEMMQDAIKTELISQEQADRINNGIDFFFFNNPDNIKDEKVIKYYENYQFLFKVYPLLPKFIRKMFLIKHVNWIPSNLKKMMGMGFDLINAVLNRNPEILAYIKYTVFHMRKIIVRKIKQPSIS